MYFALVSCHGVIGETEDNGMFKCFGCTKHTDMSDTAVTEQAGTVSLCGCVCWLMCHAVNSQHSGPELLSGDWSPADGTGGAVTLEEEPVKAGGGWRGNW